MAKQRKLKKSEPKPKTKAVQGQGSSTDGSEPSQVGNDSGLSNDARCANVVRWMTTHDQISEVKKGAKGSTIGLKFR